MNMTLGCSALRPISAGSVSMRSMTAQPVGRIQGSRLRLRRPPVETIAWTCWNPGNALPLQTEVFEAWPRREYLHPFVCTQGHTAGAAQKASLYNISGGGGSITLRLWDELAGSQFALSTTDISGRAGLQACVKEFFRIWEPRRGGIIKLRLCRTYGTGDLGRNLNVGLKA